MTVFRQLTKKDIDLPCKEMAVNFLGKIVARRLDDGTILRGRIVETECYLGGEDRASMTYNNKKTPRNEPMYMESGTTFVYLTYGMYHCFNISSKEPGACVLLRALEPVEGIEIMQKFRKAKRKTNFDKPLKINELCNGPSKLCMSLDIRKDNLNAVNIASNENLWLEDDPLFDRENMELILTSRIGIDSAGEEWAKKPLRFYILNNSSVSKLDKKAEDKLKNSHNINKT